jgi:hypothetical protein
MKLQSKNILLLFLSLSILYFFSCNQWKQKNKKEPEMSEMEKFKQGTFGYDLEVMSKSQDIIILKSKNGRSQVLLSTNYQGRVMTSTLDGLEGISMGWINHELIQSDELQQHINTFGGEDRFWVGPEGGQFSVFFKKGVHFDFENWFTPKEIDSEPFDLISYNDTMAFFKKEMSLSNYSGTRFDFIVNRNVKLLNDKKATELLNIIIDPGIRFVAFETENKITNRGEFAWSKETGTLSIWILGMLNPSPSTTIVIPYKKGDTGSLGQIVNDEYFGKVPSDRLIVKEGIIFFKGDGRYRSKIGISPLRAKPYAGSYDEENRILTIVQFTLPEGKTNYVNSMWEIQEDPFSGDAVNSYNDGPLEDGSQMGPFYELESSSPAALLQPGENITHFHRTFHFTGTEETLDKIAISTLGVSLKAIKNAF